MKLESDIQNLDLKYSNMKKCVVGIVVLICGKSEWSWGELVFHNWFIPLLFIIKSINWRCWCWTEGIGRPPATTVGNTDIYVVATSPLRKNYILWCLLVKNQWINHSWAKFVKMNTFQWVLVVVNCTKHCYPYYMYINNSYGRK